MPDNRVRCAPTPTSKPRRHGTTSCAPGRSSSACQHHHQSGDGAGKHHHQMEASCEFPGPRGDAEPRRRAADHRSRSCDSTDGAGCFFRSMLAPAGCCCVLVLRMVLRLRICDARDQTAATRPCCCCCCVHKKYTCRHDAQGAAATLAKVPPSLGSSPPRCLHCLVVRAAGLCWAWAG